MQAGNGVHPNFRCWTLHGPTPPALPAQPAAGCPANIGAQLLSAATLTAPLHTGCEVSGCVRCTDTQQQAWTSAVSKGCLCNGSVACPPHQEVLVHIWQSFTCYRWPVCSQDFSLVPMQALRWPSRHTRSCPLMQDYTSQQMHCVLQAMPPAATHGRPHCCPDCGSSD
jgi:hypothetical protein